MYRDPKRHWLVPTLRNKVATGLLYLMVVLWYINDSNYKSMPQESSDPIDNSLSCLLRAWKVPKNRYPDPEYSFKVQRLFDLQQHLL